MLCNVIRSRVLYVDSWSRLAFPCNHVLTLTCSRSGVVKNKLPDSVQIIKPINKSSSSAALKIKTISKAMQAYLERAKKHDDFLNTKIAEFEIGKQHLANMMGLDALTLTQEDIDRAIAYLLPSGLYEPKARPIMKPPVKLYPKEKAAQFDISGRPFSAFFYTKSANYYKSLHMLAGKFQELDVIEDKMLEKGILAPPSEFALNLSGGEWLTRDEMRSVFLENITEEEYAFLLTTLTRLANHPYGFKCKDDIWIYRKDFVNIVSKENIPPLSYDENGRPYMVMIGHRKHCHAKVTVRGNGTGKILINGADIFYFPRLHDREQIMYPLHFCDMLGLVDVEVDVVGPGENAQAGAIRYGISLCLRSFVPQDMIEKMRLGGLLTEDERRRGRKKPGQKGNRAKYTWKKR